MKITNFTAKDKRYFIAAAFVLLVISCFLHFWKIGEIPNGFYADEASVGYNAWCIAETGADEYGTKYPVLFKAFGNYHEPVMIYLLAPLIKIFGPEKWVVRLPSAIFLILASIAFYFLAMEYCSNRWICLCSAFVFSVTPWLFPISRVGIGGYSAMLLGMVAGWYLLIRAFRKHSLTLAAISGVCWAFAMYAHNIGRPMTAAILVCFVVAMNVFLIRRWKVFASFIAGYLISLIPMILYVLGNPESMTSRFSLLKVWGGTSGVSETISRIFERYLEYFSPRFLLISGDLNLRHHTGAAGEIFLSMTPFILTGIVYAIIKFKKNPYLRFALFGLLLYPLAAVLTIDHMHSMRCMNGIIFWSVFVVIGAGALWHWRSRQLARMAFYLLPFLFLIELGCYMHNYFGDYVKRSRLDFAAPLIEAFEYSFQELQPDEILYVSFSVVPQKINKEFKPFWYVDLLFFGKIHPATYLREGLPRNRIAAYDMRAYRKGILIRSNVVSLKGEDGNNYLFMNSEPVPAGAKLLKEIPIVAGESAVIQIYGMKKE